MTLLTYLYPNITTTSVLLGYNTSRMSYVLSVRKDNAFRVVYMHPLSEDSWKFDN